MLLALGTGILILIPSIQIQARPHNKGSQPVQNQVVGSENVETIAVDEVAEREDYLLRVIVLQRIDATSGIIVNVAVENKSGEDWFLSPQNFTLQDRTHMYSFSAQAYNGKNALVPAVLRAGEARSGTLRFEAPLDKGLDLIFSGSSDSQASVIELMP